MRSFPYAEECSQDEPRRSVPGISFQECEEISTHDESTESMGLGEVGNCSREWLSPLANVGWRGRDHKEEVH